MPDRLPQLKPQELIRALEQFGFRVRRQTGSHAILRHPETKRITTVPIHAGDVKRGLLFGILKQADISPEKFAEALRKK